MLVQSRGVLTGVILSPSFAMSGAKETPSRMQSLLNTKHSCVAEENHNNEKLPQTFCFGAEVKVV